MSEQQMAESVINKAKQFKNIKEKFRMSKKASLY